MLGINFFKFSVENHKDIKSELMDLISISPKTDTRDKKGPNSQYVDTDYWHKGKKLYHDVLVSAMLKIDDRLLEITGTDKLESWFWYQTYTGNQYHEWHVHPKAHLSSVYFIDLPDTRDATNFYDMRNKKIFRPEVEEGDVVIFPSYIPHTSGPLHGERKTIISTNYDFEMMDDMKFLENLKYDHLGNPIQG